jgi:hypothetical protein
VYYVIHHIRRGARNAKEEPLVEPE